VKSVAFGADGSTLLSPDAKGLHVYDAGTGTESAFIKSSDAILALKLSPDQKLVASAGESDEMNLLDPATGKSVKKLTLSTMPFSISLAWSPDGQKLASAAGRNVQIWDIKAGTASVEWKAAEGKDPKLAFSPDGKKLLGNCSGSGMMGGIVYIWDAETGKEITQVKTSSTSQAWARFLDDKTIIAPANGMQGGAAAIDIATGKTNYTFKPDVGNTFTAGALSHDGKWLLTGDAGTGSPALVQIWDASNGNLVANLKGHKSDHVNCVTFSADDKKVASAGDDKNICLWTVPGH
jgi:WD40 repeat protein